MQHLADGDRDGAGIAEDGCGQRIAHKNKGDACRVRVAGGCAVVSGEADDFSVVFQGTNFISGPFRRLHGCQGSGNGSVGQVL